MAKENDEKIEEFTKVANLPPFWFAKGNELLTSAKFLDDNSYTKLPIEKRRKIVEEDIWRYKYWDTSKMLYAMALECYLKGALLVRGIDLFSSGKLNKKFKSHNLQEFARTLGLKRSPGENRILSYMTYWIYAGRYPFFTTHDALKDVKKHPFQKYPKTTIGLAWASPSDDLIYNELISRIQKVQR